MNEDTRIERYFRGTGLIVGARKNWQILQIGANARFVDSESIASIRMRHPEWRSLPLAPSDIVDKSYALPEVANESFDFVVDWRLLANGKTVLRRLESLTRVMKPGAALVLPAYCISFEDGKCDDEEVWDGISDLAAALALGDTMLNVADLKDGLFLRFTTVIAALANQAIALQLDGLQRYHGFGLAVFRRRSEMSIAVPTIILCGGHCYVSDASVVRYVASVEIYNALRSARLAIVEMEEQELSLFQIGSPVGKDDVAKLLAQMDSILL